MYRRLFNSFKNHTWAVFGEILICFRGPGKGDMAVWQSWSARMKPVMNEAALKTDQTINRAASCEGRSLKSQPEKIPPSRTANIRKAKIEPMVIPRRLLGVEEAHTIHKGQRMVRNSRYAKTSG